MSVWSVRANEKGLKVSSGRAFETRELRAGAPGCSAREMTLSRPFAVFEN